MFPVQCEELRISHLIARPHLLVPDHQRTVSTSKGCNQWLSLAKTLLKVALAGGNRSLVACTSKCGRAITLLLVVTMPYACWFLWRADYNEDFKWHLHFAIWGCVLKGCCERGIFWRAKPRLKGIEDFNLEHCQCLFNLCRQKSIIHEKAKSPTQPWQMIYNVGRIQIDSFGFRV